MLNCLLDSSAAQKHPLYTDIFTGISFRLDIPQLIILNKLHSKKVVGKWLADHLLTDHLPTTYQPHTNHLPATYQPLTDHFFTVQLVQYYPSNP